MMFHAEALTRSIHERRPRGDFRGVKGLRSATASGEGPSFGRQSGLVVAAGVAWWWCLLSYSRGLRTQETSWFT